MHICKQALTYDIVQQEIARVTHRQWKAWNGHANNTRSE